MNDEGEIEFLRTYKDFIYYFNMLERNIGYCLRNCSTKEGSQNPKRWLSASFDSKIKKVMSLAKKYGIHKSFSEWHAQVEECRNFRNIISHGEWDWKWWLSKPIHFHAPEIENGKGAFTTEEFQEKLVSLKKISKVFSTISTPLCFAVEKEARTADRIND